MRTSLKKTYVGCPQCSGTGKRELTGRALETLELLRGRSEATSGADLARLAGCSGEAMCNRLNVLAGYGLVESVAFGRARLWRVR